jgi:Fe-S oxidoreductase
LRLTRSLAGEVEVLSGCCGHWQRAAGDSAGADATRSELLRELDGRRLFVLDPRCALELRREGAVTLVELAARHLDAFEPLRTATAYRYHDSCALGRGLGLYDEPRRLLARLTGVTPGELASSRELARCSGGGGLVPLTMPHVARYAAARLAAEHAHGGGGTLVTGCASSLRQLRGAGADAVDLIALLQRGLQRDR